MISIVSLSKGVEETNKTQEIRGAVVPQAAPCQPPLDLAAPRWSSVVLNSLRLVWGLPSLTPVGGVGPGEGMRRFHTS